MGPGTPGIGNALLMSGAFAAIAQVLMWRATTRWLWLIAGVTYFVGGLFVSEVWFGWATEEDLQPSIDGLSFDEVLLLGTAAGALSVLATWLVTRRHALGHPSAPR